MVPSLRSMCKDFVLKYGIGPRNYLPDTLQAEMENMDTIVRIDMSGCFYEDYHISEQCKCDIDVEWCREGWNFKMRDGRTQHDVQFRAGRRTYLGQEWRKIFLFAGEGPFPVFDDILIYDFDIKLHERTVDFYGRFYNHYSGNMVTFKTGFTSSKTSHFLKVQTEFRIGRMFTMVGKRFMRQPDTPDLDFFRYNDFTYMH